MACNKTTYHNEKDARAAISSIRFSSNKDKIPKRIYYCKDCKGFHLTSQKSPIKKLRY